MAHNEQQDFCRRVKQRFPDHFKNKKVLDVGSLDINGSNKYLFENCSYVGLDIAPGKNVDVVSIGHIYDAPDESFDTIISTEVFEHDMYYEETISNIIRMLKPGGLFLFTCAAPGRPEHGTRRSDDGTDAPFLKEVSDEWGDYYKNLTDLDVRKVPNFDSIFLNKSFEYRKHDLYFYGIKSGNVNLNLNFIDGAFIEVLNDEEKSYHVEFIDSKTDDVEFGLNLKSNHWSRSAKKYYVDWKIRVTGIDDSYQFEHKFNLNGRRVVIAFESKSLGDTLAWVPYVEKFRTEHNCEVICSTFQNKLFKDQYPNIEFVEPGARIENIYALYRIGWFRDGDEVDYNQNKVDPKTIPLTQTASDILGLDYVELKPLLPVFSTEKKKVVSIAIHSTAQSKYWNNPTGWQDVVDHLNSHGYEVQLISREEDGYMGNKHPKNITVPPSKSLEDVIKILQESELFIGISSGLSWLAWAAGTETILISGFSEPYTEPLNGVRRIINEDVCHGCFNREILDAGDWNWCPDHKGTDRQFECSREITSETVIEQINLALGL